MLLAAGVAGAATDVSAQEVGGGTSADAIKPAESPPGFWEGGGVAIGNTVLHPSFELSSSYQTNTFFQAPADPTGEVSSVVLRLGTGAIWQSKPQGRLALEAPGGEAAPPAMQFRLEANLTWNQYLGGEASSQSDLSAALLGQLMLNPQGAFRVELREGYSRFTTPGQNAALPQDRDKSETAITATWVPGGGAIQVQLGYTLGLDIFESSVLADANRFQHAFALAGRWQWLPKTEISLDTNVRIVTSSSPTKPGSTPFRVTAGLSSLITDVFGVVLKIGYGKGFYATGDSFSGPLARIELRYSLGPMIKFAAGWAHDFEDTIIGNYYTDHAFFLRASLQLGGRWQIRARAELKLRGYTGIVDQPGVTYCGNAACEKIRDDLVMGANLAVDYQITPWLFVGATYSLQAIATDFFIVSSGLTDRGSFVWNEIMAKVAARF